MSSPDAARQLTLRAIVLSLILTVLLAAANAYLGLFAGLTVATAIPAAVVSMGVLRMLGRSSILENNIVATGASAGSSIAAGTIFTIPALVIMGHWTHFEYWWVLAIAGLGGLLGVLFSVPLRRTLILDQKLQFPEGVATAEVLKISVDPGRTPPGRPRSSSSRCRASSSHRNHSSPRVSSANAPSDSSGSACPPRCSVSATSSD
jgi:putative OPT family oligopeptide transporter